MDNVFIEKVDEIHVRVHAEPGIKQEMSDYFTFKVPGYQFMPAYKNKLWSGDIRLLNTMTGLIYSGLLSYIVKFCQTRDYNLQIDERLADEKNVPSDIAYKLARQFDTAFEPRDYQAEAVAHAVTKNRALLLSPTASGKSFIIYLLSRLHAELDRKVLIVVPTTSLVSQMASDFLEYNKRRELNIHRIMSGADKDVEADYTITTWQSIYKLPKQWFEKFDVVIGDEAHNFKAKSLTKIMEKTPHVKYRYGFTGTLDDTQCFDKNTLIKTKNGKKKIKDIGVGDLVYTVNESNGNIELKKVLNVFNNGKPREKRMIKIRTKAGEMTVTEDHDIMTRKGWVKAKYLKKDDKILSIN